MITRRRFGKTLLAVGACLGAGANIPQVGASGRDEPVLGDDGLYRQPWFMDTFLVLAEDLREAAEAGKRFAVLWEQRGCPYCKEMHLVNFARPQISDYVRQHFGIVQLNIWGAREVTDFDGETLPERRLAQKWRVNFTPTIQFLPPSVGPGERRSAVELEVARMPGYFKPFHFVSMFEFVRERAYERMTFQRYLQEKIAALRARGVSPDVW